MRYPHTEINMIRHCLAGSMVKCGRRAHARNNYNDLLAFLASKTGRDPSRVLLDLYRSLAPHFSLVDYKLGGTRCKIPHLVTLRISYGMVTRWVLRKSVFRGESTFKDRVKAEFGELLDSTSLVLTTKDDLHNLGLKNRVFIRMGRSRYASQYSARKARRNSIRRYRWGKIKKFNF